MRHSSSHSQHAPPHHSSSQQNMQARQHASHQPHQRQHHQHAHGNHLAAPKAGPIPHPSSAPSGRAHVRVTSQQPTAQPAPSQPKSEFVREIAPHSSQARREALKQRILRKLTPDQFDVVYSYFKKQRDMGHSIDNMQVHTRVASCEFVWNVSSALIGLIADVTSWQIAIFADRERSTQATLG